MALKLIEDNEKSFKVQRHDGQTVHIAKTPETEPIYKLCKGGLTMAEGGPVPGKAQVKGDSPKNDTVDAKLSPGEMVIPRTVVAGGSEAIQKFVAEAMAGKHPAKTQKDGKVHADEGEYNPYQASMEAEVPQAPTPPPQFEGTPSVAGQPTPALTTSDTGMTNPQTGNAAPQEQPSAPPEQANSPNPAPPASTAPTTNVDGGGATPEGTSNGQTQGGYNPYAPVTSSSTTDSSTSHPEGQKALNDFNKSVGDNYKAQIDAGTQQQKNIAQRAAAEAHTMNEYNQKMAALNVDRNKEINSRLNQIKQVTNKFLGMSIDANHLYGDQGTGSRIMAGIGLMLGAVGQGLSGKESPVPGIIEKNIDRDINVQKANIDKAGKNVEMLQGGLKDYMGATNDMQTAMAAEKARMLDMVGKQFEAVAAANSAPMVKAQAMQQSMAFKEKAAQLAMEVQSNVHSNVVQTMQPHYESQNAEQVTKVQNNIEVQAKTEKLMDMVKSGVFNPGVVSGNIAKLKDRFGLANKTDAEALQTFAEIKDQMIHDIAGAKGLQPAEFKSLQDLSGSVGSNPEQFMAKLQNIHTQAGSENAMISTNNSENRRYPMDLKAMRGAYDKSNPQGFQSHIGYKPQPGTKKRGK